MKIFVSILFFLFTGLSLLHGQNGEILTIDFTETDSTQFLKHRKAYVSKITIDETIKTIPDSSFTLMINDTAKRFGCDDDYGDCYYYKGFISTINSFVLTHCARHGCSTFLINKSSGKRQLLFSPYDSEADPPVLSKDESKMLVFATNVYETESFISLYRKQNENFNFQSYQSLGFQWKILEAVWVNEHTIALKTFEKYGGKTGGEPLNIKYYVGTIQ